MLLRRADRPAVGRARNGAARHRGRITLAGRRPPPDARPRLLRHPDLADRRPAARPLPPAAVRARDAADDRAPPLRLRARPHQGEGARGVRAAQGAAAGRSPRPPARRGGRAALPQPFAPRLREAARRPRPRRAAPRQLRPGLLGQRAPHLRVFRVRGRDREDAGGAGPLPGRLAVPVGRPAPRHGAERADGADLREPDPPLQRARQRDRRRPLHAARGHPADGRPAVHRRRRPARHPRRRPHPARPRLRHGRHAGRGAGLPARPPPRGGALRPRPGLEQARLRHRRLRHADEAGEPQRRCASATASSTTASRARPSTTSSPIRRSASTGSGSATPSGASTSSAASRAASGPACRG